MDAPKKRRGRPPKTQEAPKHDDPKYKLITGHIDAIEARVNDAIAGGYQCLGGVSVVGVRAVQAVIKP